MLSTPNAKPAMTAKIQQPDLATIATRINAAHRSCEGAARSAVEHAVTAGNLLIEAKGKCKSGTWVKWVEANCECSLRTAQTYARMAEELPKLPAGEAQRAARLSLRGVVRMLGKARKVADAAAGCESPTATVANLRTMIKAGDKFATIYADPPWKYNNQATRAATDNHYPTMTVEEIAALPVGQLAAQNAHLHLWATTGFLPDALAVMAAWGFEYKSMFVWVKPQMGIGNYWRVSHEFLLFGLRGRLEFGSHSKMSWVEAERTKHSKKPRIVREIIEAVSPPPRLELFGREAFDGWTVWGNKVTAKRMAELELVA